jgi:phage pi2 protein 07
MSVRPLTHSELANPECLNGKLVGVIKNLEGGGTVYFWAGSLEEWRVYTRRMLGF